MNNRTLIKRAVAVTKPRKLGSNKAGQVGCALISAKGKIYTGVCIDTGSGMGFCAEHNAIGSMITGGESRIQKIVAVRRSRNKREVLVMHPCGRCREFMLQINKGNMNASIIIGADKVVRLYELLPYDNNYAKVGA